MCVRSCVCLGQQVTKCVLVSLSVQCLLCLKRFSAVSYYSVMCVWVCVPVCVCETERGWFHTHTQKQREMCCDVSAMGSCFETRGDAPLLWPAQTHCLAVTHERAHTHTLIANFFYLHPYVFCLPAPACKCSETLGPLSSLVVYDFESVPILWLNVFQWISHTCITSQNLLFF